MAKAMPGDPAISTRQVAERLVSTAQRSIGTPTRVRNAPLSVRKRAAIRLIPWSLSKEILGRGIRKQVVGTGVGVKSLILVPGTPEGPDSEKTFLR